MVDLTFRNAYSRRRAASTTTPRKPRTPLLVHAGHAAARTVNALTAAGRRVRALALHLAGFGCITAAAWQWSTIAGLIVLGVCFLVLEYLTAGEQ